MIGKGGKPLFHALWNLKFRLAPVDENYLDRALLTRCHVGMGQQPLVEHNHPSSVGFETIRSLLSLSVILLATLPVQRPVMAAKMADVREHPQDSMVVLTEDMHRRKVVTSTALSDTQTTILQRLYRSCLTIPASLVTSFLSSNTLPLFFTHSYTLFIS